jgi:hypothetical protein
MFDFSGLINAIFRKKSDDPVGSLKTATIWVQELPLADIHQAHIEIVKALSSMNENKRTPLKERIRIVMYLDEKARGLQQQLCRDFLAVADVPQAPERAYLQTILAFWEEMAIAYQICIRNFAQNPSNKLWPLIPTVTARAIYHYAKQAKWAHLRYLPVEPLVWRNLNRLYLFAERESFEKTPMKLFPDAADETTCGAEYIHAMLLYLANPESLRPSQIDLVDGWLDHWAKSITLEHEFRPHRQLYAVNLGDTKPVRSLRRNMLGEKYRYWGVGLLMVTIDKVIEQLKSGEVPARLGLSEDCRLPPCLDLIELMQKRWAKKDTARKHERKVNVKVVQVVQGFRDVVVQLTPGRKKRPKPAATELIDYEVTALTMGGTPLDASTQTGQEDLFQPSLEQWIMENESVSGCGATLSAGGQPLKIGTLVGLKPESNRHFLIGIVRRINKNPTAKTYVGIETLNQAPILVELQAVANGHNPGLRTKGIYLLEVPEAQQPRSILVAHGEFEPGRLMQLKAQGKAYTIRLQQAIEQSEDYSRVSFDVLARHHQ